MTIHNTEVSGVFNRVADLLEIEGANPFRVRAYRNAAQMIEGLSRDVADMVARGEPLSDLPGIGRDLAGKIEEIVATGSLELLRDIGRRIPFELEELLHVPGLGPKGVQKLHEKLGITNLEELRAAAERHEVREVPGFGEKTERGILGEIGKLGGREGRMRLDRAEAFAESLVEYLKRTEKVKDITVAGSFRRRRETVGDLDILVTCPRGGEKAVMERFVRYQEVAEVVSKGDTRSTVILRGSLQVDLRVVARVSYGAALHYFTGSKAHNIAVRNLALKRGLKVNEYGVFKGGARVAGRTEEEVYATVDLPFIEPELRENRGEIEAARAHGLPRLITREDIRGDLHVHTLDTDGRNSLEEMVEAARKRGYEYLAISNHSRRVTMARGYDVDRLAEEIDRIDRLNETLGGFVVLKAVEVDILKDGSLDLPDHILERLDFTVCSVHYNWKLGRGEQTRRILRAMENPHFTILGHPTGRLLGEREPYDVDMERLVEGAREHGCHLELNAQPQRLDLDDANCRLAREAGVRVAISTDAHSVGDLDYMRYGVWQARRGWLEADDVLNTRGAAELRALLKR